MPVRRRWRDYSTVAGHRPVKEFLARLSDIDSARVVAAMRHVAECYLPRRAATTRSFSLWMHFRRRPSRHQCISLRLRAVGSGTGVCEAWAPELSVDREHSDISLPLARGVEAPVSTS